MPRALAAAVICFVAGTVVSAQRATGELRLIVRDTTGGAVRAAGRIASEATHVDRAFVTDEGGSYVAHSLPFGPYRITVEASGFTPFSAVVDVRSEVPARYPITLSLASIQASVQVSAAPPTLMDPYRVGSASFVSGELLRARPSAPPGHSIVDLVNTLPGWFETSNGVLHPRGAEYQVQYVIDGVPLRDNRSPAFAQSLGIDEFESLTARTAGFPAEFGGKLGGVIEIVTARDRRDGFHGVGDIQAGSFSTVNGYASGQYSRGPTMAGASVEGMRTDRYLDPPVDANDTNTGSGAGVAGRFEQQWRDSDRTRAYAHHRDTTFLVPNEAIQQAAGQRQTRTSAETLGQVSHQHLFSSEVVAAGALMARSTEATLDANAASVPIRPSQRRSLDEAYANGSVTVHHGSHEWKAGGEASFADVDERFSSTITAYQVGNVPVFDRRLPPAFAFADRRPLREQAAYVQDVMRLGTATLSAGVRYDHYRLAVAEHAVSPRLGVAWFIAPARLVLRASYDRTFETPPVENVLLASSDLVAALGGAGRSLSLRPSRGHFYEAGLSKELRGVARLDVNGYIRSIANFFDDDLLLNTAVSFPFTFAHARVAGIETGVEIPRWRALSGSLRYSLSKGTGRLPISGGLFLGDEVSGVVESTDRFPVSEDQRHTLRGRVRYEATPRLSVAAAARFDSGLPIELEGDPDLGRLALQFGSEVIDRVDFSAGRMRPSWALDGSANVALWKSSARAASLQLDVFNLTNRLNVINFASLLSGTAIGPGRSVTARLRVEF